MRFASLAVAGLLAASARGGEPLSPASRAIAASPAEPVAIHAYFSEPPASVARLRDRVLEMLKAYEASSGGKLRIERRDPLSSMKDRVEAERHGVRPALVAQASAGRATEPEDVYGSIVFVSGDRASRPLDVAQRYPQGEAGLPALEFEISSRIWRLTHAPPKLGLARSRAAEHVRTVPQDFDRIRERLREDYDVVDVDLDREAIDPAKIPVLVLLRPRELADAAVYRLDQYLMGGGRVLIFVTQGFLDVDWQRHFVYRPFLTGLDKWLEHHGLRVPNEFVLHMVNAMEIAVEQVVDSPRGPAVEMRAEPNWFWPVFGEAQIGRDLPVLRREKSVRLLWPHPVEVVEAKLGEKRATVLVRSDAAESLRWKDLKAVDRRSAAAPPKDALRSSAVAVAVEGTFTSPFIGRESVAGRSALPTSLVVVGSALAMSDAAVSREEERNEPYARFGLDLIEWLSLPPELVALRIGR